VIFSACQNFLVTGNISSIQIMESIAYEYLRIQLKQYVQPRNMFDQTLKITNLIYKIRDFECLVGFISVLFTLDL